MITLTRRRALITAAVGIATFAIIAPLGKGCSTDDHDLTLLDFRAHLHAEPSTFVEGSIDAVTLTATFELNDVHVTPTQVQFVQTAGPTAPLAVDGLTALADVRLIDVGALTQLAFRVEATLSGVTARDDVVVLVEPAPPLIAAIAVEPAEVFELATTPVTLTPTFTAEPRGGVVWRQVRGRHAGLAPGDGHGARVDVSTIDVATDAVIELELQAWRAPGWPAETATASVVVLASDVISALGEGVQLGGQSVALATFTNAAGRWALFNNANRLSATPVGLTRGEVHTLYLPGFIRDLDVVETEGGPRALVAMGDEGVAVVDLTDPAALRLTGTASVAHVMTDVTMTDGGGTISVVSTISTTRAPVMAMETDGTSVWLADEGYGLHRTPLANLLAPEGPALAPDGTLLLEASAPTVQYAGENPWGGPRDLRLHEGRLFVAMGYLGLGVFDPQTLTPLGRYNIYTDSTFAEDYYGPMVVADEVQSEGGDRFLDDVTGMPDYRQAAFEITQVWHGDVTAPTPWADFERGGKFFYDARTVDVQDVGEGRSVAYVAYGLAGLVAVDVTGFREAGPGGDPLELQLLGFLPAVPAHGPEKEILRPSQSLFPTFGSHRLAEAGAVDVRAAGDRVLYTDHFGGLLAVTSDPAGWHGAGAPFDNDSAPPLGNHVPAEEYVTSFDMRPADPTDHESLPAFMTQPPVILATGELYGHGNALLLLPEPDLDAPGAVDALLCAAAGGFMFVDLSLEGPAAPEPTGLFAVPVYFPTTGEVGALPDGAAGQTINIGHTDGVRTSAGYLYVADGPHGVSAWRITGEDGEPTPGVHVVANTVQAEDAVVVGDTTVYPAPHAHAVLVDVDARVAYVPCRTAGLRRMSVARVEGGEGLVGAPILIGPARTDIFKHKLEETHEDGEEEEGGGGAPLGLTKQDHVYDVALRGTLAFVADGDNGLTVYDLLRDPTDPLSGYVVANLGGASGTEPLLGRATGLELWLDPATGRDYAIMACGPRGIGVVDVTLPAQPVLLKIFEPIKLEYETEEGEEEPTVHVSAADGRAADVLVVGEHAFVSYDSFGVLCYALADLIAPLPPGVDPTALWTREGGPGSPDYRPVARAEFRLSEVPAYVEYGGGALGLAAVQAGARTTLWVAYGAAGLVRLDWSAPTAPVFGQVVPTAGDCTAVAIEHGWLYVADHDGGLVIFR